MNGFKDLFISACGIIGSVISAALGGFDNGMITLIIFMAIDYITGLMLGGIFKKSPKTKTGALQSKAGLLGLCKKGVMLLVVLVAVRLDLALGSTFIRDAAVIAFIVNEAISIIENAGLMGVPIPKAVTKAIDILKQKESKEK